MFLNGNTGRENNDGWPVPYIALIRATLTLRFSILDCFLFILFLLLLQFQNWSAIRSYLLVCLFPLSSSPLVLNYVCHSLSLNSPALSGLCLRCRDSKQKCHCRSQTSDVQTLFLFLFLFFFFLVSPSFYIPNSNDSCSSAPIFSWQCLHDKMSTFFKLAQSLLLCSPLTMPASACLSPDVFVSIFPVESHPLISRSYCYPLQGPICFHSSYAKITEHLNTNLSSMSSHQPKKHSVVCQLDLQSALSQHCEMSPGFEVEPKHLVS